MNTPIDWENQRAFLAVLEEGSLSAAARRMGVAQPTVRARIETLERSLGSVLFTRSVRGLVPTAQARALGSSAAAMARASEAFRRTASAAPDRIGGIVRLSVSDFVGVAVLPPMLRALRDRHPDVVIELALSNASANLLEQEVDIAVRMSPPRQEALLAKKVAAIPLGLFAHADYLRTRGCPESLTDLACHDLIGPDRSAADLDAVAAIFPGLDPARFVVRTDSHPAQLAAARAGLGIAVVQRPVGLADSELRAVLPELVVRCLDTWIVTHEDLRVIPRVRVVFDHLAEAFSNYVRQDDELPVRE